MKNKAKLISRDGNSKTNDATGNVSKGFGIN